MSDTDAAPVLPDPEAVAAPVGVTPGSGDLTPDPGSVGGPVDPPVCGICGHVASAHTGGRCQIMLGAYGTEGPCPCPEPLP